ncbi:hypothetical protein NQ315_013043 [Exocentrus adspersus]|uniref:Uncharacterized protein n=1 Tax=Exocentrus adspersus TaxID=1586481 RepID=A0AAV8VW23_9CUCU|nr:hypothetical protein NQ315_013043 [Exocentrus adspersus]
MEYELLEADNGEIQGLTCHIHSLYTVTTVWFKSVSILNMGNLLAGELHALDFDTVKIMFGYYSNPQIMVKRIGIPSISVFISETKHACWFRLHREKEAGSASAERKVGKLGLISVPFENNLSPPVIWRYTIVICDKRSLVVFGLVPILLTDYKDCYDGSPPIQRITVFVQQGAVKIIREFVHTVFSDFPRILSGLIWFLDLNLSFGFDL